MKAQFTHPHKKNKFELPTNKAYPAPACETTHEKDFNLWTSKRPIDNKTYFTDNIIEGRCKSCGDLNYVLYKSRKQTEAHGSCRTCNTFIQVKL